MCFKETGYSYLNFIHSCLEILLRCYNIFILSIIFQFLCMSKQTTISSTHGTEKIAYKRMIDEKKIAPFISAIKDTIETSLWHGIWEVLRKVGIKRGDIVEHIEDDEWK
ncbi:hypothetical protein GWI33_016729 [Rhynchophorus ferrugineus]|uniref:Uncharacterized protein n=1 Tax=Rhynchophorus ferrugineus TaxID=354439 RepID=A0A834M6V4_RHYFE|nr:hypothetical protein GWI33_016729 [Rhynchophorus ferrugineus]